MARNRKLEGFVFQTAKEMNDYLNQKIREELKSDNWEKGVIPFVHIGMLIAEAVPEYEGNVVNEYRWDLEKSHYVAMNHVQLLADTFKAENPGVPFTICADFSISYFESFQHKIEKCGHEHGDCYVTEKVYEYRPQQGVNHENA